MSCFDAQYDTGEKEWRDYINYENDNKYTGGLKIKYLVTMPFYVAEGRSSPLHPFYDLPELFFSY